MIDPKLLNRINELAKKESLTEQEKMEQSLLRKEYIRQFKMGFKQQLESIKIVDPNGNDVTPQKIKEKRENNE